MILRRSSRTDPRLVLGSALALALPFGADLAAFAQTAPSQAPAAGAPQITGAASSSRQPGRLRPAAAADADALKQHDQELDAARAQERASAESQAKLRREIEALGDDRRALNQQLIDTAARVRDVEASIDAPRRRGSSRSTSGKAALRKSLDERRTAIVEILAALQRVGHQPPPALLVQPEDALQGRAHRDHARRRGSGHARPGRRARRRSRRSRHACARTIDRRDTSGWRAISTCSGASSCA